MAETSASPKKAKMSKSKSVKTSEDNSEHSDYSDHSDQSKSDGGESSFDNTNCDDTCNHSFPAFADKKTNFTILYERLDKNLLDEQLRAHFDAKHEQQFKNTDYDWHEMKEHFKDCRSMLAELNERYNNLKSNRDLLRAKCIKLKKK